MVIGPEMYPNLPDSISVQQRQGVRYNDPDKYQDKEQQNVII